jgi:two-component system sensor histidine kinase CpxA
MRFFWRILLSVWLIVLITTALTLWAANFLLSTDNGSSSGGRSEQIVAHIARDLRRQLAIDPSTSADVLAREHTLDFTPLLEIYLLDPDGNDVLGRTLPATALQAREHWIEKRPESMATGLLVREVQGYLVIGYEGFVPLARQLASLRFVIFLILSAVASFLLARFIVQPVRRLQSAGRKVAAGDLSVRVAHTVGGRTDEIARLAHDFDAMTTKVDALLRTQQRLMRDVSHELRSPLARLQAILSIARQSEDSSRAGHLDRMEAELEQLDELIGQILAYARLEAQQEIQRRPTDIADLVENIVDDASLEAQAAGKQVRLQGPPRLLIDLDSSLIQSAVENVVRNALKHTVEGTAVDVRILDENQSVRIVVDDTGPGIPPDIAEKIFEPFYRIEDSRGAWSGSGGIGLAIAKQSVRAHGGTITAKNRESGGLRVEIALPLMS